MKRFFQPFFDTANDDRSRLGTACDDVDDVCRSIKRLSSRSLFSRASPEKDFEFDTHENEEPISISFHSDWLQPISAYLSPAAKLLPIHYQEESRDSAIDVSEAFGLQQSTFSASQSFECESSRDDSFSGVPAKKRKVSKNLFGNVELTKAKPLKVRNENDSHTLQDGIDISQIRMLSSRLRNNIQVVKYQPAFTDITEKENVKECQSMIEPAIKSALNFVEENPDLIGDFSVPHALPLVQKRKHDDLKTVSHSTLRDVLNGKYCDVIECCTVVDCRYPYEYEAGHILGAKNLYTKDAIMSEFFHTNENRCVGKTPGKRNIIVFHCEFSSERGPNMLRFLRNWDRKLNENAYPNLHHPEIYLLENGYKEFFQEQPELCHPRFYKPMLHKEHCVDMRKYRSESASTAKRRANKPKLSSKFLGKRPFMSTSPAELMEE